MSTAENATPYGHPTVKAFALTSGLWFAISTTFGLIGASFLIAPDFLANVEYIHFGRIRPMHVNAVLFGFVTPGLIAVALYFLPKLLKTRLYSDRLGLASAAIWNVTIAAGMVGVATGHSQGREYAELPWAVDLMVIASFALVIVNVLMTIRRRNEPILYVSIWYAAAAVVLTACTYALGNVVWKPDTGALSGLPDAILLWFYGHNVFGLLLSPMALGVAYYVLPIATRSPLYSHTLSLLGFWSLIIVYTHIGTHHLLQVPVPTWLKTIAIVDSIAMVIPVMVFLINIWYTVQRPTGRHPRGHRRQVRLHRNDLVLLRQHPGLDDGPAGRPAHHPLQQLGGRATRTSGCSAFAGVTALGGIYFILPRMTGTAALQPASWRTCSTGWS